MIYGHQITSEIMVILMGKGPTEAKYGLIGLKGLMRLHPYMITT